MKYLVGLLCIVAVNVRAAGLANLFADTKKPVAPAHPQSPKPPITNPAIQQAAKPQPTVAPKPATPAAPTSAAPKPAGNTPNPNPTTVDNKNCSPTDSTCKR